MIHLYLYIIYQAIGWFHWVEFDGCKDSDMISSFLLNLEKSICVYSNGWDNYQARMTATIEQTYL